jgi:hypothetical protein
MISFHFQYLCTQGKRKREILHVESGMTWHTGGVSDWEHRLFRTESIRHVGGSVNPVNV